MKKMKKPNKKKSKNLYWTNDTESAIKEYNLETDELLKEKIFRERIFHPLDKLAENIINRFKFPYMDGGFDDIKSEVISYLVLKLQNFTSDKGKSFSYFSVVAKNYLILQNNKRYKNEKRSIYFSDETDESFSLHETLIVDPYEEYHSPERADFLHQYIKYWDYNMPKLFKKKRDLEIAYAVLELMRRAHMIENFNKKAIYLMIREITDCQTAYITRVVKKMKDVMDEQYREYKIMGKLSDYQIS